MINDQLGVIVQTILSTEGIDPSKFKEIQKIADKYKVNITAQMNTEDLMKSVSSVLPKIISEINSKYNLEIPLDVDGKLLQKSIRQYQTEIEKVTKNAHQIQLSIDTEKYSTDIAKLRNTLSLFGNESGEVYTKANASLKQLEDTYSRMSKKGISDEEKVELEKQYQKELSTTKNLLTQIKSVKENEIIGSGDSRRTNMVADLNNYLSKNTAMTKQSRVQIEKWIDILSSADEITKKTFNNIKSDFKQFDSQLRKSGELGLSMLDKFKQAWEKFGGWSLATGALTTIVMRSKEAITNIKEVDDLLTEISKTSDSTPSQLKQIGINSYDNASKYGVKNTDYLTGVQEMNRSGFYDEQGEGMAKLSIKTQSSGDVTADVATDYLLATSAAYQYAGSIEKLNAVLDGQNEINKMVSLYGDI